MNQLTVNRVEVPASYTVENGTDRNYPLAAAYVANTNPDEPPVNGLAVLGLGAVGRMPVRAACLAARRGVSGVLFVQGLRYDLAPSADEIVNHASQAIAATADYTRQKLEAESLHIIGESQNGPAALEAAIRYPDLVNGTVVLLHSLGTNRMRRGQFIGRLARAALQPDQMHGGSLEIGLQGGGRVLEDALRRHERRLAQLDFALAYEAGERIRQFREEQPDRKIYATAGTRDCVFPPHEQAETLEAAGVLDVLRIMVGASHSTPASSAGAEQVLDCTRLWSSGSALPTYEQWCVNQQRNYWQPSSNWRPVFYSQNAYN